MRGVAAVLLVATTWFAASGCGARASDTATASPSVPEVTPTTQPVTTPINIDDWQVAGTSVQGRPIRMLTVGHGPRKVLFIGGIHGDETEGAYSTAQLPAAFVAEGLADSVTLTILEDANPDGRAAGTRDNANGVDVNRNFPASNFDKNNPSNGGAPLTQPEAQAVTETINRINPDLVVVAHSWAGRQFINFDGPSRAIAARFSTGTGMPAEETSSIAPTPGSLGSYFGRDRNIPVLTIEFLKGSDGKADWEQIRVALLQAIRG